MKNIGLDVKPVERTCSSIKCPWHGSLRVRGRVFTGRVVSAKAADSAVVEWDYYQAIPKYERSMRKKTRIAVHNPSCIDAKNNDIVTVAECRPLSKTKSFVIVGVEK